VTHLTKQTRDEWFNEHPQALRALDAYLTKRESGKSTESIYEFSQRLMSEHCYPFGPGSGKPDANLAAWIRSRFPGRGGLKAEEGATGDAEGSTAVPNSARKKPRLAEVTFRMTDEERAAVEAHGTYVVTSAQNDTEPDMAFLEALEVYQRETGARLLVIPVRYKNPTSRRDPQESNDGASWHPRLLPYLCDEDLYVHERLRILGRPRIQAMSPQPLAGLESVSQGASAIFGHPQLAMKAIATPQNAEAKLLYTTGSVTKKNGSLTSLGYRGTFHQSHAAIVAEVRPHGTFLRELVWSGAHQCFHDLDRVYYRDRSERAEPVLALITGDEHAWFNDPAVRQATYGDDESIAAVLQPGLIVRHDVLDCYSISHHHERNAITRAIKAKAGLDDIRAELDDTLRFIDATTPEGASNVIVWSNHHDHLARWLKSPGHIEPKNLEIYHELMWRVLRESRMADNGVRHPDPFELYARDKLLTPTRFLAPDESFQVMDIELGMHGHLGPNGVRGTARNLSAIGTRSVVGHAHSAAIYQGVYQVGASSYMRLEYNAGPSSWTHSHVVIHRNGKRQMIHILGSRWRG
jgi:hypothetical protein